MSTLIQITKPTELIVNNTPIIGGVAGRVLFQGTGDILQQSANISWDNTNVAFFLGSVATRTLIFRPQATSGAFGNSSLIAGGNGNGRLDFYSATNITQLTDNVVVLTSVGGPSIQVGVSSIALNVAGATQLAVAATTGNIVIGGGADAGFRLDVNGTARVQGATTMANGLMRIDNTATGGNVTFNFLGTSPFFDSDNAINFGTNSNGGVYGNAVIQVWNQSNLNNLLALYDGTNTANERLRVTKGGNLLINTTTDAGFKLDVNGDTIFRRVTNVTPNTITGGTQFFTVKSGNWPTALIRCFENGVINLGSSSGSIGFDTSIFNLPVSSTFIFNYVPANQLNTFAFILSANYTNLGAGGTSEGTMLRTSGSTSTSVGAVTMNQIESKPTYNNTGGTTINRGFYYNPILTSMTNTTHYAIHSTSGRVRLEGLPTSAAGLSAGEIWNDGGTIRIV